MSTRDLKRLQAELTAMLRAMPFPDIDEDAFVPTDVSNNFIKLWAKRPSLPLNTCWMMGLILRDIDEQFSRNAQGTSHE